MTLQSTETKTTGSVAVIAVGPSDANWFMAKKAVIGQSYLWPILPVTKGRVQTWMSLLYLKPRPKTVLKGINFKKAFLTRSKAVW